MGKTVNRCVLIVIDSLGVGAMPDAAQYGDEGSDTLGHIMEKMGKGYALPNLSKLGLYRLAGKKRGNGIVGAYGRMACKSPAKDTTAGHWELAGLVLEKPFPTYPKGFPPGIIVEYEKRIGTRILGNYPSSGTEIINKLGDEHCRTGYPIVYTSADSVFQVAAHESAFGLERLYSVCKTAREMLVGKHAVGRVIARPFVGANGDYTRTSNRRDYALSPFEPTVLDMIKEAGGRVVAVGKIEDIFNGRGISKAVHTGSNGEGMKAIIREIESTDISKKAERTLIFANLVDFDMLWGHRRDVRSYALGLKEFDEFLPSVLSRIKDGDILIVTADHGCDPTFTKHTDHTREFAPVLVYGGKTAGRDLGTRESFADVAQTISALFGLKKMKHGKSFADELGLN
ncbi:MAG: phosphopentomutase [Endomicrobiales bacterium]|nr:phosphopentomutase [Endomicrobiales bacterium]